MKLKPNERLVRVRPHNPARGHFKKSYSYGGFVYRAEAGWVVVSVAVAEYLATTLQTESDISSPCVFDIAESPEQARNIERAGLARSERRAPADVAPSTGPRAVGSLLSPEAVADEAAQGIQDVRAAALSASRQPRVADEDEGDEGDTSGEGDEGDTSGEGGESTSASAAGEGSPEGAAPVAKPPPGSPVAKADKAGRAGRARQGGKRGLCEARG